MGLSDGLPADDDAADFNVKLTSSVPEPTDALGVGVSAILLGIVSRLKKRKVSK